MLIQSYADVEATQAYLTSFESFEVIETRFGERFPVAAMEAPGSSASYSMPAEVGLRPVNAARASARLFEVLQSGFVAGRSFVEAEAVDEAPVIVISAEFAVQQFGSAAEAIGQTVSLNGIGRTVVGVVPAAQVLPFTVDVVLPMDASRYVAANNHVNTLGVLARLPTDMAVEVLDQQLVAAAAELAERYPNAPRRDAAYRATPIVQVVVSGVNGAISGALIAVALLVAVTLANVGALVLVRVNQRRQSFVVCTALGASRSQLLRSVLADLTAPCVLGTLAGIGLAWVALPILLKLIPVPLPNPASIRIDWSAAALVSSTALAMSAILALFGAWRIGHTNDADILRQGARSGTTRGLKRALSSLVVAQIAAAVFLVSGSMLLVESFGKVLESDQGFNPDGLMTVRVTLPASVAATRAGRMQFIEDAREAIAGLPGVSAAGLVTDLPIGNSGRGYRFSVDGQPLEDPDAYHRATYRLVTPGYIEAMGTRPVEGRLPTVADDGGALPVVVVSRFVAEKFWPGQSALGRRIKRGAYSGEDPWLTVVGVVENVRDQAGPTGPSLRQPFGPSIYIPFEQYDNDRAYSVTVVARSAGTAEHLAPLVRARLADLSGEVVLTGSATMRDLVLASLSRERLLLVLFSFFAGVALLLAAFGIYAVVSYVTQLQDRETGIRVALGSTRNSIARRYLARGAILSVIGGVAGVAISVAGLPRLQGLLFETAAVDWGVYGVSSLAIAAVVLIATAVPAVRASRINPVDMLRAE